MNSTTGELRELKEHIRWLEDELSTANNIDGNLENIDGALTEIKSDFGTLIDAFNRNAQELKCLFNASNAIADAINRYNETLKKLLIEILTPKTPAPFASTNKSKERATTPKRRNKTKLSVVPKKDEGAAS